MDMSAASPWMGETEADSQASSAVAPLGQRLRWLAVLALALALSLWSSLRGINFGHHWDERKQIEAVERSAESGRLLPDWYNYPSISYLLCALPLLPEIGQLLSTEPKPFSRMDFPKTKEELKRSIRTPAYKLAARRVFLWVSYFGPVWLVLGLWRRRSPREACLAGAIYALSFELCYHARWIAPDAVLTQFVALFVACLLRAQHSARARRWLLLAALAAGLATGSKYTAGLLLLPLGLAAWLWSHSLATRARLRWLGQLGLLYGVTYLLTTPGTLLEPVRFYQDLKFERRHYTEMGHYGYSVAPGTEHAARALQYLSTALGSPHLAWALLLAGLVALGIAVSLRRSERSQSLILLAFPLVYFVYFAGTRVLFVRNLLVFLPFAALYAARGVETLAHTFSSRGARLCVWAAALAMLTCNAGSLVRAARTIRSSNQSGEPAQLEAAERRALASAFAEWLRARPELCVQLSPELLQDLQQITPLAPQWLANSDPSVEAVALYTGEGSTWGSWQSNRPGLLLATFGPREVNYEWYTSWTSRRILVLTPAAATALGIRL